MVSAALNITTHMKFLTYPGAVMSGVCVRVSSESKPGGGQRTSDLKSSYVLLRLHFLFVFSPQTFNFFEIID